jgi:hypothetical protein
MTNKEIKILLKDFFIEGDIIGDTYQDKKYLYVIRTTKELQENGHDDRVVPERHAIFRIEKETKQFEEIHPLFFPIELLPKETPPTLDDIAKGIIKRQFINERDFLNIVQIFYGENYDPDFNFENIFYDEKYEREIIWAHFKNDELRDKVINFLEVINVKCKVEDDGWLVITRVPEQS